MNRYSIFGILTAILFVILPFATSRHLFHAAINIKFFLFVAGTLLIAGIAAWMLWKGQHTLTLKNRPLLCAGTALLGVFWLSAFFGIFPERSIFGDILRSSGVYFFTHIAAFSFILGEFLRERDWTLVRRTLAVSAGVYSFLTLLGVEGFGISARIFWTNFDIGGYTFGNTTFAGTFLVLALLITFIELVRTPAWSRWWYALVASCAAMFFSPILINIGIFLGRMELTSAFANPLLLLGSARASSAAAIFLLILFGGYLIVQRFGGAYKKYLALAWGTCLVGGALIGVALLLTPGSTVQEKYIEASTGARILVWQSGFEAFKDRPLLGWGPENFEQAHQEHFDNRLYQDEYIGEIWFDRAHNVIIDTLVNVGALGALAHLFVVGAFLWAVYKARVRELIGEPEAVLLFSFPLVHFLQLQTGFDTIGSFTLLAVMGGYVLSLERRATAEESAHRASNERAMYYKIGAAVIAACVLVSGGFLFSEINRQHALYRIFVVMDRGEQLELVRTATSRASSFEILRFSSLSLLEGVLESIAERRATQASITHALDQIAVYEGRYRHYIEVQPDYYRARTALAYLLSVKLVLGGEDNIEEAKALVARGYELSPGNLLTPAMEALLELYSGDFARAKEKADSVVIANPDAPFGRAVLRHVLKQEETFPTISVMRLENL